MSYIDFIKSDNKTVYPITSIDAVFNSSGDNLSKILGNYSLSSHNHDTVYAKLNHSHSNYSLSTHNHDSVYAKVSHTHDDRYYTESEVNTKLDTKANTSHTHSYLPLSGGTITGPLKLNRFSSTREVICPYNGNVDGMDFYIQGGGNVIIGSGEGAGQLASISPYDIVNGEMLAMISDISIELYTNAQFIQDRKGITIDKNGTIYPHKADLYSLGATDRRFSNNVFGPTTFDFNHLTTEKPKEQPGKITFNVNNQYIYISPNEFDVFRNPAGLYIYGDQYNTYLWNEGDIITSNRFVFNNKSDTAEIGIRVENKEGNFMPIRFFWSSGVNYGVGTCIGEGGRTIIGAGESPQAIITEEKLIANSEELLLCSDDNIRVTTNCNNIKNRLNTCIFRNNGVTEVRTVNATLANGYQQQGTNGKISAVQSGSPNGNMLWAW